MGVISRNEAQAVAQLAVLLALAAWFQMRMMDGWTIVEQPAPKLLGVYVVVLAVSTIAAIVIEAVGANLTRGRGAAQDERDYAISARAGQHERFFILAGVNVLIWQALMEGVFAGHALPAINLLSLPTLFFCLFMVLFGGEIVRLVSIIWLYRSQAARG
jgi:hypothetical protein